MKRIKRLIKLIGVFSIAIIALTVIINIIIIRKSHKFLYDHVADVPECYTAIVLGAKVSSSGAPSDFLQDRLDVALELYNQKKIKRFPLSGDHGQTNYDEVNNMKNYLLQQGINTEDIFLDHAGFDTYNTMVRAGKIFRVKEAIIVTQEFHLARAVYIARYKGIQAYGIKADRRKYNYMKQLKFREVLAKVKAFGEVAINKNPKFLGNEIPIRADSRLSYD